MRESEWHGSLVDPAQLNDDLVRDARRIADAGRDGDWATVLSTLTTTAWRGLVNSWRPGGDSWFTPLHAAAWHGASPVVVRELLHWGARTHQVDANGRTAAQVAIARGHEETARLLVPQDLRRSDPQCFVGLDRELEALVESRIRPQLTARLRFPQTSILLGFPPGWRLWCPVPGMHGGFSVELRENHLFVQSWSRVVAGSGQAHVVTRNGFTLVDDGFV